jgi:xanthine dehydrogenase accessory factor
MRDVVERLIEALAQDRELILCQVVETRGSTPQKAGALMVVDPLGGQLGTLGGGCVENEVKQKAIRQLCEPAAPAAVHSFVLDHDYAWADGLICGGKMVILTQAVRGAEALSYFRALNQVIQEGAGYTEAVFVNPEPAGGPAVGSRFLCDGERHWRASWPALPAPEGLARHLPASDERPKPRVEAGVAFLPGWPRIRLVVVGAGHVGQAVGELAAQVDFDVWVVDDRHQYASPERFPRAQRILVGPIEETLASLAVDRRTYALIVTRGHGHDQEALFRLAPTLAPYVGLIGSRRKIRLIFEGLRELGVSEDQLRRVSAPVGLEIGSQTVTEIAISIVAELIARRNLGPNGVGPRGGADTGQTGAPGARTVSPVGRAP